MATIFMLVFWGCCWGFSSFSVLASLLVGNLIPLIVVGLGH